MTGICRLSACGIYRYVLTREIREVRMMEPFGGRPLRTVNFVMLNPSTATDTVGDPTVARCIGYAEAWGYEQLAITNLFAFRATDPRAMKAAQDPVGPGNDEALRYWARASDAIVCAWGTHGGFQGRGQVVRDLLEEIGPLKVLKLTKHGHPSHPLYLPKDLELTSWARGAG